MMPAASLLPSMHLDPARSRRAQATTRLRSRDAWLVRLPLMTVTLLSKISVPPFGAMGLALGIPAVFVAAAGGVFAGRMVLDGRRLTFFALMACVLLMTQVLIAEAFSLPSLLLFFVVHLPYVLRLRQPGHQADVALVFFRRLCMCLAGAGIAQYLAQFIVGPTLAFPIENLLPTALLMSKYNSQAVLEYGSTIVRSNGIFMLEPSLYSQLLAGAIVVELAMQPRLWRLGLLAAGILVSYSGTGLMLLGVCLVAESLTRGRWKLLLAALVAAVGAVILAESGVLPLVAKILARAGEFGSPGSSGSMRFVAGFAMFEQLLWPDVLRAFFGYGAGSFASYSVQMLNPPAEMIIFKVVFEFGLVGAALYFGFLGYCVLASPAPSCVRLPVACTILLGGMYTPLGHCLAFSLLLWPQQSNDVTAEARSAERHA